MIGWRMPTRVEIAPGARHALADVLGAHTIRRVLMVVDPGLRTTDWPDALVKQLGRANIDRVVFDALEPNPRTTTAERASELARAENVGAVVALGGGSALDAGKAAAMLATNRGRAADFVGNNRFANPPLPFIAMPTTCGTGSEVTWVSVLSDPSNRTKISIKGERMFPSQALVDPDLLATLPASLVATTGADALTHAIEATTCRLANPVSDALAEQAIALLFRFLPRAVADIAGDEEARFAVARASTLAGLAFGNADVASVHCLSEAIGGMFDVPHGLANAVLLRPMLEANRPIIDNRLASLAAGLSTDVEDSLGAVDDVSDDSRADAPPDEAAAAFLDALGTLLARIEIPAFDALGVPTGELDQVARQAEANGSNPSNARRMTAADYRAVLEALVDA